MKPVPTSIAGKVGYLLCSLALLALVLTGGAYTHLNAMELGDHSHEGFFALSVNHHGGHGHARTDVDRQFDMAAIHCGSDILGLDNRNQVNVSCRAALGATGWGMEEPEIPMIEPPPPRTATFAL